MCLVQDDRCDVADRRVVAGARWIVVAPAGQVTVSSAGCCFLVSSSCLELGWLVAMFLHHLPQGRLPAASNAALLLLWLNLYWPACLVEMMFPLSGSTVGSSSLSWPVCTWSVSSFLLYHLELLSSLFSIHSVSCCAFFRIEAVFLPFPNCVLHCSCTFKMLQWAAAAVDFIHAGPRCAVVLLISRLTH